MKKAFTLIELMIAVSILTIGVVMVLKSFLNSASVLDSLKNRLTAIAIIEKKACDLQEKVKEDSGIDEGRSAEDVAVGNRTAVLETEISSSEIEAIKQARVKLSWQEENKQKDETLVVYLPAKK